MPTLSNGYKIKQRKNEMPTRVRDGKLVAVCVSCGRVLAEGDDAIRVDREGATQCGICAETKADSKPEFEQEMRYAYGR